MTNWLNWYASWIDDRALINVEDYSGRDVPFLHCWIPFFLLLIVFGVSGANTSGSIEVAAMSTILLGTTVWMVWVMIFYRRAKLRHRQELGIPDWREKMKLDAEERQRPDRI